MTPEPLEARLAAVEKSQAALFTLVGAGRNGRVDLWVVTRIECHHHTLDPVVAAFDTEEAAVTCAEGLAEYVKNVMGLEYDYIVQRCTLNEPPLEHSECTPKVIDGAPIVYYSTQKDDVTRP